VTRRHLIITALSVVAFLVILTAWLVLTESGLRLVVTAGSRLTGGLFSVRQVQGRLAGTGRLEGLEVNAPGLKISAERVRFRLEAAGLFRTSLVFKTISVEEAGIVFEETPGRGDSPPPSGSIALPVVMDVGRLTVDQVTVGLPDPSGPFTLQSVDFSGRFDREGLTIRHLTIHDSRGEMTTAGHIGAGEEPDISADVTWSLYPVGMPPIRGGGNVQGTPSELTIKQEVSRPVDASFSGRLKKTEDSYRWSASLTLNGPHPEQDPGGGGGGSIEGFFSGGGTFNTFRIEGNFTLSGLPGLGTRTIECGMAGGRDGDRWDLDRLDVSVPGTEARLTTTGYYDPVDPGPPLVLVSDLKGVVWPLDAPQPWLTLPSARTRIDREGSTYRVEADGSLKIGPSGPGPFVVLASTEGSTVTVQKAALTLETAAFDASGSLSDRWDGQWKLSVSDLGGIRPSAGGSVEIRGTVRGEKSTPVLAAQLEAEDLHLDGVRVQTAKGTLETVPDRQFATNLDLSVRGLEHQGLRVDQVDVTAEGSAGSHTLRTRIMSGPHTAQILIEGAITGEQWQGTARAEALGGLLTTTGKVSWGDSLTWSGSLSAGDLHPARFQDALPEELSFDGVFNGSSSGPSVSSDLTLTRIAGLYRSQPFTGRAGFQIKDRKIAFNDVDLTWASARFRASGLLEDRWSLTWTLRVPEIQALLEKASGSITASGTVTGPREEPGLDFTAQGSSLSLGPVAAGELLAKANLAMKEPLSFRVEASLAPVTAGKARSGEVVLRGGGSLEDHTMDLTLKDFGSAAISLSLRGGLESGSWSGSVSTGALGGDLEVRGTLTWQEGLAWTAGIGGQDLDPGTLWGPWQGSLSTSIAVDGSFRGGELINAMEVRSLTGTLRGQEVRGSGRILSSPRNTRITLPDLWMGRSHLGMTVEMEEVIKGEWDLDLPDLSEIIPALTGSIRSSGRIAGAPSLPSVMASLVASDISGNGWSAGSAAIDIKVPEPGALPGSVAAHVSEITRGGVPLGTVSLDVEGNSKTQDITLSAVLGRETVSAALKSRVGQGTWSADLVSMEVTRPSRAPFSLEKTAGLEISRTSVTIQPLCLTSGQSRLCAEGSWEGAEGSWSLEVRQVPLSLFTPGTDPVLELDGILEGTLKGQMIGGRLLGSAMLSAAAGSVHYRGVYGRRAGLTFTGAQVSATLDERGLEGSCQARIGAPGGPDHLTVSFSLPGFTIPPPEGTSSRDQPVRGEVEAQLSEISFLQAFVEELDEPAGQVKAALEVGGTMGKPVTVGSVTLEKGSARVPLWGISLEKIDGRLTADPSGRVTLDAAADSGSGRLQIQGSGRDIFTGTMGLEMRLRGEKATVANAPDVRLVISPDLTLTAEAGLFSLSGAMRVPEASFAPAGVVLDQGVSPDIVVLDAGPETRVKQSLNVRGDVTFILGDKVSFDGYGLTGHLSGSLRIVEEPGTVTAATGQLTITDGLYRAFGQKLAIERGILNFSGGDVENPGLDIRAVRRTGEILAGVQVGGTLKEPDVSLFSDPPMEQADALSYLLLGKPLKRTSGEEGQLLSTAALTMGMKGGEALARRIGGAFGLDEVSVQTGADVEQSTLVVGRYLTPSIYVRYGVGIFQEFNLFQFGYRISDRLQLQGESGEETSTDLLYTIER